MRRKLLFNIAIALLVSSLVVGFSGRGTLKRLESAGLDLLFRLKGPSSYNPRIMIIEIDDENISSVGRWPWDRQWHATLTRALKYFGAKSIYFNIIFSESAPTEEDSIFSEAIEDAGNVYLPFVFTERAGDTEYALFPIEEFRTGLKATAPTNIEPDMDGSSRKIPLFFRSNGDIYPYMALNISMDYLDMKIDRAGPDQLILSNPGKEVKIPLIDGNKMIINWLGKWNQTFKHYSFLNVLNAYKDALLGAKTKIDISNFKGSVCLVAVNAVGLRDMRTTPLEAEYPDVGIMATAISDILDRDFITPAPLWLNWLLIYILGLVPSFFISGERPFRGILSAAFIAAVFSFAAFWIFKNGYWVYSALPLVALFTSYSCIAAFNFIYVSLERQRFLKLAVTDGLTGLNNMRYFKVIMENECLLAKRAPDKKFCVIMTDIDHFKGFNDTYGHATGDLVLKEVAGVLKDSVRSTDVVARYGGEEMIILLKTNKFENGLRIAGKIRSNVEKHTFRDDKNTYNVKISLGVSIYHPLDSADEVIKRADEGLYKAKEAGRDRVETTEGEGSE